MLILLIDSLHRILERRPRQSRRPGMRRLRRSPVRMDKTSCAEHDLGGGTVYVFFASLWAEFD
jgi:hypothetical protein